ncbi:MAG TPA: endonuclease V [Candidatus Marinimicrobia bacterium]|nr:endonuclease V [Candidatus Neomarinimicrobiota bacterium]HRS51620.1 endonuclease V [Candidatus Neomarinimicrobiota bacterium]HRU92302.1 endonuclease V [Candidatus Neomarinimicrobiota bacterium]
MQPVINHPWQVSIQEAKAIQLQLAKEVIHEKFSGKIIKICAVDVSYGRFDSAGYGVLGWFAVTDDSSGKQFDCQTIKIFTTISSVAFPYVPGYLSFREIPVLLSLFQKLPEKPDLVLVDGAGVAHPRGIGLAAHLGVIFDIPTIGCAKSRLFGNYAEPANESGAVSALTNEGDIIGYVLRTKKNTRPLFISPGHRTDPQSSLAIIQRFCGKYRIPEPLRTVDLISKELRRNPDRLPNNMNMMSCNS